MTIDEAIKWFEDELTGGKCSPDCVQCNADEMALSALRYQRAMVKLGIGRCNPEVFEDKSYAAGWNAVIEIMERAIKEIMSDD